MFSFKEGEPISLVNNKILYKTTDDSISIPPNIDSIIPINRINKIKTKLGNQKYRKLLKCIEDQYCDEKDVIYPVYDELINAYDQSNYSNNEEIFSPIPCLESDQNDRIYICGPSGSGKSTYLNKYIENYHTINPDNNIYLYSALTEDNSINSKHVKRVDLNAMLPNITYELIDHMSIESFPYLNNSLAVFDDTDSISNEILNEFIVKLKNCLLETGRHINCYIAITNHKISDYNKTKTVLNECSHITLFPSSNKTNVMKYLTKTLMMTTELSRWITNLNSRWITICNKHPMYILWEHGCKLI